MANCTRFLVILALCSGYIYLTNRQLVKLASLLPVQNFDPNSFVVLECNSDVKYVGCIWTREHLGESSIIMMSDNKQTLSSSGHKTFLHYSPNKSLCSIGWSGAQESDTGTYNCYGYNLNANQEHVGGDELIVSLSIKVADISKNIDATIFGIWLSVVITIVTLVILAAIIFTTLILIAIYRSPLPPDDINIFSTHTPPAYEESLPPPPYVESPPPTYVDIVEA